jgi:pimeloyl-ACP methyl ester carboxylesterase
MATHHRFAEIAGRRIFYREAGPTDAPAVVLLHGTPASSHMYRNLIPALADRHHVIAPDYPGFGHSDAPSTDEFDYTFDALADHVEGLLDHLGLQQYSLYVQDYGAPVGWRLALRHPDRITAIVSQNGNAYVEGFVGDAMEPLFAYGRDRSEANAKVLRDLISIDGLKWQYTHGVSDPTVVDPDVWVNAHAAVASSEAAIQIQLALFAHGCTSTSAARRCPCWRSGDATTRSSVPQVLWRSPATCQRPRSICSTAATSSWRAGSTRSSR